MERKTDSQLLYEAGRLSVTPGDRESILNSLRRHQDSDEGPSDSEDESPEPEDIAERPPRPWLECDPDRQIPKAWHEQVGMWTKRYSDILTSEDGVLDPAAYVGLVTLRERLRGDGRATTPFGQLAIGTETFMRYAIDSEPEVYEALYMLLDGTDVAAAVEQALASPYSRNACSPSPDHAAETSRIERTIRAMEAGNWTADDRPLARAYWHEELKLRILRFAKYAGLVHALDLVEHHDAMIGEAMNWPGEGKVSPTNARHAIRALEYLERSQQTYQSYADIEQALGSAGSSVVKGAKRALKGLSIEPTVESILEDLRQHKNVFEAAIQESESAAAE